MIETTDITEKDRETARQLGKIIADQLSENGADFISETSADETIAKAVAAALSAVRAQMQARVDAVPPPELTWIYTHCRAIGMTRQSESGKWEHDIALFTMDLKERAAAAEAALERARALIDELKAELAIAREDLQRVQRDNGQFGVGA